MIDVKQHKDSKYLRPFLAGNYSTSTTVLVTCFKYEIDKAIEIAKEFIKDKRQQLLNKANAVKI